MEIIYAPWRMDYLVKDKSKEECVFCDSSQCYEDKYVLFKGKYSYVKLNTFPYNCGHLLIIPNGHVKELNGLSFEAGAEIMKLLSLSCDILKKVYNCDAINVGLNLGKAAGAGIEQHLHFHIIPRWEGDVSFYTVCSELRVVSEILDDTFKKLSPDFKNIAL